MQPPIQPPIRTTSRVQRNVSASTPKNSRRINPNHHFSRNNIEQIIGRQIHPITFSKLLKLFTQDDWCQKIQVDQIIGTPVETSQFDKIYNLYSSRFESLANIEQIINSNSNNIERMNESGNPTTSSSQGSSTNVNVSADKQTRRARKRKFQKNYGQSSNSNNGLKRKYENLQESALLTANARLKEKEAEVLILKAEIDGLKAQVDKKSAKIDKLKKNAGVLRAENLIIKGRVQSLGGNINVSNSDIKLKLQEMRYIDTGLDISGELM